MIKKLVFIITLLLICITMMAAALMIEETVFMQISGYFALACVCVSLVGVFLALHKEKKDKNDE